MTEKINGKLVSPDTRNIVQKVTDSRKMMIAIAVDFIGLAANKFLVLEIPVVHLWYGTLGIFGLAMILIAWEDVAEKRAMPRQ